MEFNMIKSLKIIFLQMVIIWSITFPASAQKISTISKPVLEFRDNNLHITYNLPDEGKGPYKVWIEIRDSNGNSIDGYSFTGDIGSGIKTGINKHVYWNIGNDGIILEEAISVRVLAQLMPKQFSKVNLMFSSALLPGLGQSKITYGKPYWLGGVAAYGCLAGSYWYNTQAVQSYKDYLGADTRLNSDNYYDMAIHNKKTSEILAYSAMGIWIVNMIWMAAMPDRRDFSVIDNKLTLDIRPQRTLDYKYVTICLSLNLIQ